MSNIENLESTKLSLINSEQLEEIKNNPATKATILSVIKAIPVLGELIDGTIDASLNKFQQSKRNELLDIILSTPETITSEMVNDVEFIINFAKTLEAVNRLGSNDKVKYFANIIKNGYLSELRITDGEFEEYLYALSTMSYRQINILIDLYIYELNNVVEDNAEDKTKKNNKLAPRHDTWSTFVDSIAEKYTVTQEDVISILSSISKTGFCSEVTGAYFGYTGGVFYITSSCKRFIEMISDRM